MKQRRQQRLKRYLEHASSLLSDPNIKLPQLESGKYERSGPEVMMVDRFSAALYLPGEYRLPVGKTHTDMVKFASEADTTFQTVVTHIKECIGA
jgi:hypothetical protein